MKVTRPKFNTVLNLIIALLVAYLLVTLVHVQTDNAKTLQGIKHVQQGIQRVQADQQQLLKAQADSDKAQRLDSENKLDVLICLVLVPQDQRTIDVANNCRAQATAAVSAGIPAGTASHTPDNTATSASPQSVPPATTSQPTNPQSSGNTSPPSPTGIKPIDSLLNKIGL